MSKKTTDIDSYHRAFSYVERIKFTGRKEIKTDNRPLESVEEYLKRGNKITKCDPGKYESTNNSRYKLTDKGESNFNSRFSQKFEDRKIKK